MARLLQSLGTTCARHPVRTLLVWMLLAVATTVAVTLLPSPYASSHGLAGAESTTAAQRLAEHFPGGGGPAATIVVHTAGASLRTGQGAAALASVRRAAGQLPHTAPKAGGQPQISADGSTAMLQVAYDSGAGNLPTDTLHGLEKAVESAGRSAGVEVSVTGELVRLTNEGSTGSGEVVGFGVAALVLLVAFGSVVSAGVPVVTAGVSLATGLAAVGLLASRYRIDAAGPALATMIGVGVGVDYALLMVTRHREELLLGHPPAEAAGRATATAGLSVVSAGVTVIVAILGLAVAGVPVITSLGVATAVVVVVVVAAGVTLVPALLGLAAHRLNALHVTRLPLLRRRAPLQPDLLPVPPKTPWYRWARVVERHPLPYALASALVLVLLALPTAGIRLGQPDASSAPVGSSDRRGFERIAAAFGAGASAPLTVVVAATTGTLRTAGVDAVAAPILGDDPDVAAVAPAVVSSDGTTAALAVLPRSSPQSEATNELVHRLRERVLPGIRRRLRAPVLLTGSAAAGIDFGDRIAARLPVVAAAVLVLSFLLLVLLFRSIVVPLKAVLLNLLSIGASYGVLVAVFQWGWLSQLVGLHTKVPVLEIVPMIVFAVAFGLSMDYEVFLLSRVREEWLVSGDSRESVVAGLTSTARVISAAATIMVSVFLAFTLSPSVTVKMFGVGLATAVLLDATLIRLVLVPATMTLLGDRNWYLPRWLDRLLPRLHLESGTGTELCAPGPPVTPAPDLVREEVARGPG